jgi:DNA ligase-1
MRRPASLYEWKRSSTLLKVKTFSDEEAMVIAHQAGSGKNSAVMGALVCKTP